jgi:hypothetical protein
MKRNGMMIIFLCIIQYCATALAATGIPWCILGLELGKSGNDERRGSLVIISLW